MRPSDEAVSWQVADRPRRLAPLVVALAGGSLYLNALRNPFVYDDYRTIVDNGSITSLSNVRAIVFHEVTRPLTNLSFAVDRAIWGPGPFGFHLTNILLHVLNVILLYRVAWWAAVDQSSSNDAKRLRPGTVASVASALFAVHPLMTEAVGYVSARADVLGASFFLLAFLCARRWMRASGSFWWTLAIAFWMASLLAKETAAVLPLLLIGYEWLILGDRDRDRRRARWWLHAPLVTMAAAAAFARLVIFLRLEQGAFESRAILDQVVVVWRYVALLVVPSGQAIFHAVRPVTSAVDPRLWGAIAALAATVALAARIRRAAPLVPLGLAWFILLLMPSSAVSVLGASEGMAEHRAYLASCGIFLLIGSVAGLETSAARASPGILGPLARVAFVVVLLAFSARTVLRNLIWRDPIALWQEASVLSPGHWLPRTVLGESFHRAGQHAEAAAAFEAALQMRPRESELYLKLAICLAELGRTDDATAAIERLRRIDPVSPVVSTGLGAIALITGDPDKARAHFLETLDTHPSDVMALQWLAVLEEDVVANPAEAIRRCEEIQRIAPGRLSTSECLERNRSR